jgi:protein SCO1/2
MRPIREQLAPPGLLRVAFVRLALGIIAFVAAATFAPVSAAPLTIDGHFTLTRLDGREVTDADFRGKWLVIYFGYTFCPDVCPTVLAQIGAALDQLGPLAKKIQPIFITVDPARDSAKVMTAYMKSFDPRIVGLRGDPADLADTAARFHVYFRLRGLGNGQYTVDHSSFIYVMNPKGQFVELLTGDLPGHGLADALRKLVK